MRTSRIFLGSINTINFKLKPNYDNSQTNPVVGLNFTLYDTKRPKSKHIASINISDQKEENLSKKNSA